MPGIIGTLRELMRVRSTSILELEDVEREIKGDRRLVLRSLVRADHAEIPNRLAPGG
jgi:hypothetical protein